MDADTHNAIQDTSHTINSKREYKMILIRQKVYALNVFEIDMASSYKCWYYIA